MKTGVDTVFEQRLSALVNAREAGVLQGGLKGVEKESLRVDAAGRIARTAHPISLGSALTNDHITTDFSEALIELVTPTFTQSTGLESYLSDLHRFVYQNLGDELLWATSMPCDLNADADVPTAQYGTSNVGKMKTLYREGLRNRYGALMQAISGVHFNYSFPSKFWGVYADTREVTQDSADFRTAGYFDLLRSYRRHGWIILYLFGVSPAVSCSFLRAGCAGEQTPETLHQELGLELLGNSTLLGRYATSLRMSDVGYRNRDQSAIHVSVNSLDAYLRDLRHAISTPHPPYQALESAGGPRRQLNTNLLQIENEYYSYIRPKRVARPGESPSAALRRAGVEYVEMRALDVSAFDPLGVNQTKLLFLEAFAAYCLLSASPLIDEREQIALDDNHLQVARRGREPGLTLRRDGRALSLKEWAANILDGMTGICEMLDAGDSARPYSQALRAQQEKLTDIARTPSARLQAELQQTGESFQQLALRVSRQHRDHFRSLPDSPASRHQAFTAEAAESLQKLQQVEAVQRAESFDQYLNKYFATP